MGLFKITPSQLNALMKGITAKQNEVKDNINYKLDYVKMFIHPDLKNILILKSREHGITGGQPFDEIYYDFYDESGKTVEVRKQFVDVNSWYAFISEIREVKIVAGQLQFI